MSFQAMSDLPPYFEPPAHSADEIRERHEDNRQGWNEGAQAYTAGLADAIEFIRVGKSNLHPIERRNLTATMGDLKSWCKTAVHLQCASGKDTLSLWNEGVERVIGVDISDVHIDNARRMTDALKSSGVPVNAGWYRCDVLDTPHELDGAADLVYTGRGALCWLHDLDSYMQVVARLLKPSGVYSVLDNHPMIYLFDPDAETYRYSGASYFEHCESSAGWPSTYIGDSLGIPVAQQSRKHERSWTFMEIFHAVQQAGLTIVYLGEHAEDYWDSMPNLKAELRGRIPMTFSMVARRRD